MLSTLASDQQEASDFQIKDQHFSFSLDFKGFLLPLLQKNRRLLPIASLLLMIYYLEVFALVIRSSKFYYQGGLMPTFHYIFAQFNLKYLIPENSYSNMIIGIFCANLSIIFISILSMSDIIMRLPKKNFIKKLMNSFNLLIFQSYNWLLMLPILTFSAYTIKMNIFPTPTLSLLNITLTIIISNLIESLEISISFKIEDHLSRDHNLILFNYKVFVAIITGFEYFNEPFLLSFYIWNLFEYCKNPHFHSFEISHINFSCIIFSIFATFFYYLLFLGKYVDFAYLFFFAGTIITKFSIKLLNFIVTNKIERILCCKETVKINDFQLYNREIYRHFRKASEGNLDSKIIFLTFFSTHQEKCQENACKCKSVLIRHKHDFIKNKKLFLNILNYRFKEYLNEINESDFQRIFLNYCSFSLTVLKIPSKCLNLIFSYKDKLNNRANQLHADILIRKSKKMLEKKLLNNDQYAQTLASVIVFDKEVRHTELRLKRIIEDMINIHEYLLQDNQSTDKLSDFGGEILRNIEKFKAKIMILLDKNVKNTRLLQLTALSIKYLTEDLVFRNFYKQLNIKRINQALLRKSHVNIDIFDHDSGVLFISLGESPGNIEKCSKNFIRLFNFNEFSEILHKNVSIFMPKVFAMKHDEFLKNFIESGKGNLLISNQKSLFAVNRLDNLLDMKLLIRLDTIFTTDFVIGGYIKLQKNFSNRTILMDSLGNLMNYSRDCENIFNKPPQISLNMMLLMPELIDRFLPTSPGDIRMKQNMDFKQKGFLLCPKQEASYMNCSDFKVISGLNELLKKGNEAISNEFLKLRENIFEKFRKFAPQDLHFNRVHYQVKTLGFAENTLEIRILEIFDIFEVNEIKLISQYLTQKTGKLKASIQQVHLESPIPENILIITEKKTRKSSIEQNLKPSNQMETYISGTNREQITQKLNDLQNVRKYLKNEQNTEKIQFLSLDEENNKTLKENDKLLNNEEKKSPESSNPNVLNPESNQQNNEASKATISASFEMNESEYSLGFDNEIEFEQKISEISNNQVNRLSSEDSLTNQDDRTQTYQASQISRVSSHASGDTKKNTISGLMNGGSGKLRYFQLFAYFSIFLYILLTILLYVLSLQESYNLQRIIGNSGLFHDQLSPVCALVRDVQAYEWTFKGILNNSNYLTEIKKSFDFSYNLLGSSYQLGVKQADASMDFIYNTYLMVKVKNLTLYSEIAYNGTIIVMNNYIYPDDKIKVFLLDLPKTLEFFLAASQHVYMGYLLNKSQEVSDLENYHWFLKENVLVLITNMLQIFSLNKGKINDSVGYLNQLNNILILMISGLTVVFLGISTFISIKIKLKCQKFCRLFWFFPENDIQDRIIKLSQILDRYFEQGKKVISEKFLSTDQTFSQTASSTKLKTLNRSLLRPEDVKLDHKRKKRRIRRSNSLKVMKNVNFRKYLIFSCIGFLSLSGLIIGVYATNYASTRIFMENVIDVMNDIDSLETYSITISIRYAINSVLLGLFDQPSNVIQEKISIIDELLKEIDVLQGQITDLSIMFRKTGSSNILTDLKYEFFTKDLCQIGETLKTIESFKDMSNLLGSEGICENLLKNVLTKGSTSLAFSVNELFQGWHLLMNYTSFSTYSLLEIIRSQEFIDANLALSYVYAIGKYYSVEMQQTTGNYFDQVRNGNLIWVILTMGMIIILFSMFFKNFIKYLKWNLKENFSLIGLFPFWMINCNKVLENKISKMFRMQKV